MKITQIGCLGAGYVGGTTCSIIAHFNPEIKVYIYDINEERIKAWNSDVLPIYEPGLDEIVKKIRGVNLFFTTDYNKAIVESELVFFSVNTRKCLLSSIISNVSQFISKFDRKSYGLGKGRTSELKYIEKCAKQLRDGFKKGKKIIVEKSTVPVQTSDLISKILHHKNDNDVQFQILSNPEFLAEGTAVKDLTNPDRILIGGEDKEALEALVGIYAKWIARDKILLTTVWSSELSKLVANALLAQRVSSMNAVSALCEKVGANVYEISGACGKDTRIGAKFLQPSVGFGGSCFQKDILNLCYLCEIHGLPEVSEYFNQIIKMNNFQRTRFANKIIQGMFGTLNAKKLVFLGFAFKKDTSDTRESSPIYVGKNLLEEKAQLIIHDPKVHEDQIYSDMIRIMSNDYESETYFAGSQESLTAIKKQVSIDRDIYSAVKGADALIVFTEWDCFKGYDYEKIYSLMEKPAFVFDGRNLLDHAKLKKIGFETWLLGSDKY